MVKWIFADFETYYAKDYTLRKLTPVEYILDPRYETIGCSVAEDDGAPFWLEGDDVARYLRGLPIEECALVSHNMLFDGCIVAFRYGLYPKLYVDTMSMARALLSHVLPRGRVSLDNVAGYLKLGGKTGALANVIGMRLAQIKANPALYQNLIAYANNDLELCRGILKHLKHQFPASEYLILDMVVRMATQPQFVVNQEKLYEHLSLLQAQKASLLSRVGISKDELMSNDKFALALQRLGVDPPTKISPTTGKVTWAFAKTDPGMEELGEHDDPDVQALHAARVSHKSTLAESRTERLISISKVTYDGSVSWLPIPLRYSGAHTHRFSGDWKINEQNLPPGPLRDAHEAPEGHVVLTCDASQIEARLTAWICQQTNLIQQFENKEDVYSSFATDIYGVPVTKADKPKRLGGKISILGLGFGMGDVKFQSTWRVQSTKAGMPMELEPREAKRIVDLYRWKYSRIKGRWYWLNDMIPLIASGEAAGMTFGPCTFEKQAILLPSGLKLYYHDLRYEEGEWFFTYAGKRKKLYGGKMLENIIQSLDRICVMDAAVRIHQRLLKEGFVLLPLAHQVHDELIYVPRGTELAYVRSIALEEMARRPVWGPDLPLDAEVGVGNSYGKAK